MVTLCFPGYLIEEIEPVDFEGETEMSVSEDESESDSVGSESDNDEESQSSSSEGVTLQDLLQDSKEEEEESEDDDEEWDPSKSNPTSAKKKKAKEKKKKKKKGLSKIGNEACEDGEQETPVSFPDWFVSDEDDVDWSPSGDGGKEESSKKHEGKKSKAKKLKLSQSKNEENGEAESPADEAAHQDERPRKKAKKSKSNAHVVLSDKVMQNDTNDSNINVQQKDRPNSATQVGDTVNSSQNLPSPNKVKSEKQFSKDAENKADGRQQGKSPNVSPTKKGSAQVG